MMHHKLWNTQQHAKMQSLLDEEEKEVNKLKIDLEYCETLLTDNWDWNYLTSEYGCLALYAWDRNFCYQGFG